MFDNEKRAEELAAFIRERQRMLRRNTRDGHWLD